jgi:hypothetical protein
MRSKTTENLIFLGLELSGLWPVVTVIGWRWLRPDPVQMGVVNMSEIKIGRLGQTEASKV